MRGSQAGYVISGRYRKRTQLQRAAFLVSTLKLLQETPSEDYVPRHRYAW